MIQPYDISLKGTNFLDFANEKMGGKLEGDFFFISSDTILPTVGLCNFYRDDLGLKFYFKWTMSIEKNPRNHPFRIGTQYSEKYVSKEYLFDFLKKEYPEHFKWIIFNQDFLK